MLESELFGYMNGSFTGANENRRGLFQAADGGTLFLDEIGNMSLTMQVKLYRVLQEGKVRPLGSTEESDVDVRVIAATNKDFDKEIAEGRFREDLYYRLSVIPIHLPPLRERREDIPLLVRSFLDRYSKSMGKKIEGIDAGSHAAAGSLRLARKRARAGKHHRASRGAGGFRADFRRRVCRCASASTSRRRWRIKKGTATATARSCPPKGSTWKCTYKNWSVRFCWQPWNARVECARARPIH